MKNPSLLLLSFYLLTQVQEKYWSICMSRYLRFHFHFSLLKCRRRPGHFQNCSTLGGVLWTEEAFVYVNSKKYTCSVTKQQPRQAQGRAKVRQMEGQIYKLQVWASFKQSKSCHLRAHLKHTDKQTQMTQQDSQERRKTPQMTNNTKKNIPTKTPN